MSDLIQPLRGNVANPIRVGNTVHRDTGPWTPTVHALLRHIRERGFDGAPTPLGVNEDGREVLEYIEGVDEREIAPTEASLRSAISLIRRFHDATVGFDQSDRHVWNTQPFVVDQSGDAPEIVAHNDLGTWNLIYRDAVAVAIVDWDFAAPASRLWDLASATWCSTPMYPDSLIARLGYDPSERPRRFRIICDTYGVDDPRRLLDVIRLRLHASHPPDHDYVSFFESHLSAWKRDFL
jgi:hypothetical protein